MEVQNGSDNDLQKRIEQLEKAQPVDAATQAGAHATQAATHAGTWSTMLAGGVGLVVGMFLALTISATRT
jgi:ElaB/YqjD/DUF883 family membrane-anchored ribosome-binding protein